MNKWLIILGIMAALQLSGCGGGGGGSSSVEAGITVGFQAQIQQSAQADGTRPQAPAGSKQFRNSEGVLITLNKAYLTLWSATLENDCADAAFARWLDWLLPAAYAHADLSPTRLATPNIINLLAADGSTVNMGNAMPPPNRYCGVTVALQQADDDAQYLPTELDMIKRSVYLEGTYQLPNSTTAVPFILDTGRTLREAKRRLPTPLNLSASNRQGAVKLSITYDRWFDAVDFSQINELNQQDWILNQISASVSAE